jgi:hypothetical protein
VPFGRQFQLLPIEKYREVGFVFKSAIVVCEIGFFLIAAGNFVLAAVPISTIQSWRDAATDVVSITVLSVDQKTSTKPYSGPDGSVTTYDISLTARVDAVDRSANALTPQTTIIVHYNAQYYEPVPPPGGNYGTILKINQKAKAYLKKDGNEYRLAGSIGCLEKL